MSINGGMMQKIKHILIFVLLAQLFCCQLVGQGSCGDNKISEAEKLYKIGKFEEVESALIDCIMSGFSKVQKIEAYRLIALSKLALDSLEASKRVVENIIDLKPNYEPPAFAPPVFIEMVTQLKQRSNEKIITSVSKKEENVLEAPATVMVITEEDIINRGYADIEEVMHDIPGFSISKGKGPSYSNLYQRGYRSTLNDRTLFLIDGVEQNDLTSDNAPISRQYPLSNIRRIEIIYGPASTMYGANAYLGVINIITKNNLEVIKHGVGMNVSTAYSSYNTKYLDAIIGVKKNTVSISFTARYFKSDEMDISKWESWDFNLDNVNYPDVMNISEDDKTETGQFYAQEYIDSKGLDTIDSKGLYEIQTNSEGVATAISLTSAGEQAAFDLDYTGLNPVPGKNPVKADNSTTSWYMKGCAQISNFTFSLEAWKNDEGRAPWYNDSVYLFRQNYSRWINWYRTFSINYEKPLSKKLFFSNLASYRLHTVNGGTNSETFKGYYNSDIFSFYQLAQDSMPKISTTYLYRTSNQLRNETRLLWFPARNIDVMSGIEFRSGLIQGEYLKSNEPNPLETGKTRESDVEGTDHFRTYDCGVFSQISFKLPQNLNCVIGGRLDYNRIRQTEGYDFVFNPRLALIYNPDPFIFKIIYATAFKDASFLQKYGTTGSRLVANPELKPERVKNIEISGYWKISKNSSLDASFFSANYTNVVGTDTAMYEGKETTKYKNIGKQNTVGLQTNAKVWFGNHTLWGNYTYLYPVDSDSNLVISDIARHSFNLGINSIFFKHLNLNLMSHYTGERLTGLGTSGSSNPKTSFDPYMIFNLTVGYSGLIDGLIIQLGVRNLLDKEYFDPGVREATSSLSSYIPQHGRTYMVRILFKY